MATFFWARHGENVANVTRTLSYRVFDGDLTPAGQDQARALAARLAGPGSDRIGQLVCSPLRRARQTAEIVGQVLGLRVAAELEALRELNVGTLDGRSDQQAWDRYDAVLAAWQAGDIQTRFPGGENCLELHRRISAALGQVAASADGATSLIVAHGGALRQSLTLLTGDPDPGSDLPTGSYAVLETGPADGRPRLVSWPSPATDR